MRNLSSRQETLARSQATLDNETEKLLGVLKKIEDFIADNDLSEEYAVTSKEAHITIVKNPAKASDRIDAAQLMLTDLDINLRDLKTRLGEIEKILGLKGSVKLQLDRLKGNKEKQKTAETLRDRLKSVLTVVEEERKNFVQDSIDKIEADIRTLYEAIHPGEELANIKIILDPNQKGSAHLLDERTNTPPQAYFSESHLDTLGICIWLAFIKRYSTGKPIIILDDVLTSVDNIHLTRFIDVIDEQAKNFGHIILTTHYRLWRDKYKYHQAANSNVNFIELKEWAKERGIIVGNDIPCLEELKAWLDPHKFERVWTA